MHMLDEIVTSKWMNSTLAKISRNSVGQSRDSTKTTLLSRWLTNKYLKE